MNALNEKAIDIRGKNMSDKKTIHETLVYIQQNLKAPKNQHNNFGNYNYRSCEDILEAVKPLLGKCSLTIDDEIVNVGERYYVKATAKLYDGENLISNSAFARESADKKGMDDSQITGATSSYARKYALNGLFAIDDTKDADTMDNSSTKRKGAVSSSIPTQPQPKQFNTYKDRLASDAQKKMIFAVIKSKGLDIEKTKESIKTFFKIEHFDDLNISQAKKAIDSLLKKPDATTQEMADSINESI